MQLNTFALCPPRLRPPVHHRRWVLGPQRLGLAYRHVAFAAVRVGISVSTR